MRNMLLINLSPAALLALIGCQTDFTPVTVRFIMAPEPAQVAKQPVDSDTQTVVEAYDDVYASQGRDEWSNTPPHAYHVALWGGKFDGDDVTYSTASLKPGSYTFVSTDWNQDAAVQGWVSVNATGFRGTYTLIV